MRSPRTTAAAHRRRGLRKWLSPLTRLALLTPLAIAACEKEDVNRPTVAMNATDAMNGGGAGAMGAGGAGAAGAGGAGAPGPAGGTGDLRFFLPTGMPDNTSAPSLEIDAGGALHAIYPAYARGGAYYAFCPAGCSDPDQVKVVRFDTAGTVHNAMLALDAQGRPRVLLSTAQKVYWASCDEGCGQAAGWTTSQILDHQGDREITGEALALDPQGRPRFVMHTYRAYLGIGQKPPETDYVRCDGDCNQPGSWTSHAIATEIWEGTTLRFDATGRAHAATVVGPAAGSASSDKLGAYLSCAAGCDEASGWTGIGLMESFELATEAVAMQPTVALALTRAGAPRVLVLGKNDAGQRNITFFECDDQCTHDHWRGSVVSDHAQIGPGLDLALDGDDRPRFVYTIGYNIALAYCDGARCGGPDSSWELTKIERGAEMPTDQIFLYDNCTVGAWFLHSPSLALTAAGAPRVGYQARDISGGYSRPDPKRPACVAGTDMTWSRLAVLSSYR